MIAQVWKYHKLPLLLSLVSLLLYYYFGNILVRSDFNTLISLYSALFILFYFIVKKGKSDFWLLAGIAILFRLIFIPLIPNLSQDFYRFIWDGRMLTQGLNPYLTTPQSFIENSQSLSSDPEVNFSYDLRQKFPK